MGFLKTAAVTARIPSTRTFLQSVQRIINAVQETQPSSLTSPSLRTTQAMNACNEALVRIWTANRWRWRYRWIYLDMEDTVFMYELPDDFDQDGSTLMRVNDWTPMPYTDYHRLMQQHPQLAIADPTIYSEGGASFIARIATMIGDDASLGGIPDTWSIVGDYVALFPVPWDADVDSDDWDEKERMMMGYYGSVKELSAATDTLPIPTDLYSAHHWLSLAYLKEAMSYQDFQADEARGERLLKVAVARSKVMENDDIIMTPWGVQP